MPSFDNYTPTQTPKALLCRRSTYANRSTSLLKLNRTYSLGRTIVNNIHPKTSLRIPPEILDRIIMLAIGSTRSFASIASFSLASSGFRQIAFRQFFWTLRVKSSVHWSLLCEFLDAVYTFGRHPVEKGYFWVRNIRIQSTILASPFERLDPFVNLRSLSIDFSRDGLSTQLACAKRIFGGAPSITGCSFRLESLTLTSLSRIDVSLLKIIATRFPRLIILSLSCTERLSLDCCWGCLEDSATSIVHSPIPDMFVTSEDLAIAFAKALEPLTNLTRLHLGIFLSKETYLTSHFQHEEFDSELYGPEYCTICIASPHDDDLASAVRRREREASIAIARKLKNLVSVGWSSFFPSGGVHRNGTVESGDAERTTTVFIWRGNGRIKARIQPW